MAYLLLHLFLLGGFDLGDLVHAVDLDLGAHDLDLVVVHGSIGADDLGVGHGAGTADADRLLQDEAIGQEGVSNGSAGFLYDMDVVQVRAPLEPQHGVHGQLGEVLLVLREQFRGERRLRDVQEVLVELLFVLRVVGG